MTVSTQVQANIPLWGGRQKGQKTNLTLVPKGTQGTIKDEYTTGKGSVLYLVKFPGVWVLCAGSCLGAV